MNCENMRLNENFSRRTESVALAVVKESSFSSFTYFSQPCRAPFENALAGTDWWVRQCCGGF